MTSKIQLPDFEDMIQLADKIRETKLKKLLKEIEIEGAVADIVKTTRTNQSYFENGKPPSMSFVESTYSFTGFNKELLPIREEHAELSSDLSHAEMLLRIYHEQVGVWRTVQASERTSLSA